ncbi:MAG: hypothetical protein A2X58_11310 [Nitrospirae bacterium GWC2_56_14]|nr:MAG: hypothetical protein A2X58_11310 [Nitrospirae bacterium GWC2_56_14]
MPRLTMMLLTILCLLLLTGCSKDWFLHGMYEGLRTHNDLQSTPAERVGQPDSPNYGDYERMRKERATQNPGGHQ